MADNSKRLNITTAGKMARYAEAPAMLRKGRALAGEVPSILPATGQACGLLGDQRGACESLADLERLAKVKYVPTAGFAVVHLGLGEKGAGPGRSDCSCSFFTGSAARGNRSLRNGPVGSSC